jgi:transcriptional regulator with XRE-family HTH domain
MPFNEVLRRLRGEAGLTQEQLAEQSKVPIHSIRSLEQGQRIPGLVVAARLAKGLGVSLDALADCDEVKGTDQPAKGKRTKGKDK